jgi:hypothetical protein
MQRRVRSRASVVVSNVVRILQSPGASLIGASVLVVVWLAMPIPPTSDAENIWQMDLSDPYRNPWGSPDSFVFSPVVALLLAPMTALPFIVFFKIVLAANLAAMAWMVGPAGAALALLLPPVQGELRAGNIDLLIGAAIVLSFRRPAAWAMPILTKVTPAVGLLWFAVRREWRPLATALATTFTLVVVTWLLVPWMWADWLDLLSSSATVVITNYTVVQVPVFVRLPIAAGLVYVAARRGNRWLVPIAVLVALPAIWFAALSMLLAVFPLLPWRDVSQPPVAEPARAPV